MGDKRNLAERPEADLRLCAHLGHSAAFAGISEADIGTGWIIGLRCAGSDLRP